MPRMRAAASLALTLAVALAHMLRLVPAAAQDYEAIAPSSPHFIPRSADVERLFDQAAVLERSSRWAEAAALYDKLLERAEPTLVPAVGDALPGRFLPLEEAVLRRVLAWPRAGREVYGRSLSSRAAALEEKARRSDDASARSELARRYFPCATGARAIARLAREALEQGRPAEALRGWRTALDLGERALPEAGRLRVQTALAALHAGRPRTARLLLDDVSPDFSIRLGHESSTAGALSARLASPEVLSAMREPAQPSPPPGALRAWVWWSRGWPPRPIDLGEADDARGSPGVGTPADSRPDPTRTFPPPVGTPLFPLVAGSSLYVQDGSAIFAIELQTGRVLERQVCGPAVEPEPAQGEPGDEPEAAVPPPPGRGCVSAGGLLIANVQARRRGRPDPEAWPCLAAFQPTTLRPAWSTPAPREGKEPTPKELRYETAPVASGRRVFAAALGSGFDREVFVSCLEGATGATLWCTRCLVTPRSQLPESWNERSILHPLLALAGETVLCDSGVSVLVALEAQTGRIRWVRHAEAAGPPLANSKGQVLSFGPGEPPFPGSWTWSWSPQPEEETGAAAPASTWTRRFPLRVLGTSFGWLTPDGAWSMWGGTEDGTSVSPPWLHGLPFASAGGVTWTLGTGTGGGPEKGGIARPPRIVRVQGLPEPRVKSAALASGVVGDGLLSAGELVVAGTSGIWRLDRDSLKVVQDVIPWPAVPAGPVTLLDVDGDVLVASPSGIGRLSRPQPPERLFLEGELPEDRIVAHQQAATRVARAGLPSEALTLEEAALELAEKSFGPGNGIVRQARERVLRRALELVRTGISHEDDGMVERAMERIEKSGTTPEEFAPARLFLLRSAGRRGDAVLFAARARGLAALPPELQVRSPRDGTTRRLDVELEESASEFAAARSAYDREAEALLASAPGEPGAVLRCLREFPGSTAAARASCILGLAQANTGDRGGALDRLRSSWHHGASAPEHEQLLEQLATTLAAGGLQGFVPRLVKLVKTTAEVPQPLVRAILDARRWSDPTTPSAPPPGSRPLPLTPHPLPVAVGDEARLEAFVPRALGPFRAPPLVVIRRGYEFDAVDADTLRVVWSRRWEDPSAHRASASPGAAWVSEDLLVLWSGVEVVGWDRKADRVLWKWSATDPEGLRLVAPSTEALVLLQERRLSGVDPRTGTTLWTREAPRGIGDFIGTDVERGWAFYYQASGGVLCVRIRSGRVEPLGLPGPTVHAEVDGESGSLIAQNEPVAFIVTKAPNEVRSRVLVTPVGVGFSRVLLQQKEWLFSEPSLFPWLPALRVESPAAAGEVARAYPSFDGGMLALLSTGMLGVAPSSRQKEPAWTRAYPRPGTYEFYVEPGRPPVLLGVDEAEPQAASVAVLDAAGGETLAEARLAPNPLGFPRAEWVGSRLLVTDSSGPQLLGWTGK